MSNVRHIYKPSATTDDNKVHDDDIKKPSGSLMERINNPVVFSIITLLATTMGVAGYIYQASCVTTIEKRFQLKSQHTAILPIVTDAVGVCTMLFIVHYASSRHRPRVISCSLMLTGLGLMLYSVPHFLYPVPPLLQTSFVGTANNTANSAVSYLSSGPGEVCNDADSPDEDCSVGQLQKSGALLNQAFWLFVGAGIVGLSTSLYPLFIVHIDDGVEKKKLPIYMGVLMAVFAAGSLLGYGVAIYCLQIPAYISDPEFNQLTPYDPSFLGAWWLGFLVLGLLQVILAFPIFFFPRYLPKPKDQEIDVNGTAAGDDDMTDAMLKGLKFEVTGDEGENFFQSLVKSIWRVLSNPTLAACFVCYIALSAYFAGAGVFGPKYMQTQFNINPYQTAMLSAVIMLPPGLFGNLLGGIVVRIFGNTRLRTVTIVVVLGVVVMLLEPLFLIFGCKNGDIAGLTVHYQPEGATMADIELPNLDAGCHEGCGCKDQYTPVCGSDGVTYATACFAGCQSYGNVEIEGSNTTVYLDCACIPSQETSTFISGSDVVDGVLTDQYAVQGACPLDPPCQSLLPFLILSPLIMTIGTMLA
ncbi:hypothetical protein BSL78_10860, partial [Apostichopus japonicus]